MEGARRSRGDWGVRNGPKVRAANFGVSWHSPRDVRRTCGELQDRPPEPSPLSKGARRSRGDWGVRSGAPISGREHRGLAEPADKPGSVVDSHSSRRSVAATLEQPTRTRRGQRHEVPQAKLPRRKKWRSRPVSRVLSWTVIPLGHASPQDSSNLPGSVAGHDIASLFGLAPGGVCRAGLLPGSRCALTAPFHPCPHPEGPLAVSFCCTIRRLAPPRRYLAPCPVEPGLSSACLRMTRLPGRLRPRSLRDRAAATLNRTTPPIGAALPRSAAYSAPPP
jgi:hypothetical protein